MALKKMKKSGGGKLSRSEVVTIRLDPKLRYLAELAARKQRRSLSSYIEWAIEESLQSVALANEGAISELTVAAIGKDLWDVDEADRFALLALSFQELLTHEEQLTWKVVKETHGFWSSDGKIDLRFLRAGWEIVKKYAGGEISDDDYDAKLSEIKKR